jgi:hypothetical protein
MIDLSLSLFPWALFRTTKAAVKMHTLLDMRRTILYREMVRFTPDGASCGTSKPEVSRGETRR